MVHYVSDEAAASGHAPFLSPVEALDERAVHARPLHARQHVLRRVGLLGVVVVVQVGVEQGAGVVGRMGASAQRYQNHSCQRMTD